MNFLQEYNSGKRDFQRTDYSRTFMYLGKQLIVDVNFESANLEGVAFNGSTLIGVNFKNANLTDVNFRNCKIKNCTFEGANTQDAIWTYAVCEHTDIDSIPAEAILEHLEQQRGR